MDANCQMMDIVLHPNNRIIGAIQVQRDEHENRNNAEVQWDIVDKNFAQSIKTHEKGEQRAMISGITVRFDLQMKTKERYFELFMVSLHERDLELDLEIKIKLDYYNYERTIKGVFNIVGSKLGRDGKLQKHPTSLFWDNLTEPHDLSRKNDRHSETSVQVKFIRLMSRNNNYPKPRFTTEHLTNSMTSCPTNSLADDMWRAFLNEIGADCTITCEMLQDADQDSEEDVVEQRPLRATFRVQKAILASRSEVFSAMFSNNQFSEHENNSLHITDMSPQALREMLRFLYTDKMENANLHAKELLMAANKYNIPRMQLQGKISKYLDVTFGLLILEFSHKNLCDNVLLNSKSNNQIFQFNENDLSKVNK